MMMQTFKRRNEEEGDSWVPGEGGGVLGEKKTVISLHRKGGTPKITFPFREEGKNGKKEGMQGTLTGTGWGGEKTVSSKGH